MQKFLDNEGREWQLSLTIRECRKLKDAGFDFVDKSAELVRAIDADGFLLLDVAWQMCREQHSDVSEESFMLSLPLEEVRDKFREELLDFFRRLRKTAEAKLTEKMIQAHATKTKMVLDKIEGGALDRAIQAVMTEAEAKMQSNLAAVGKSSGNSPESLA